MIGVKVIFDKFKALHPGSKDIFDPTIRNVMKWIRANKIAEFNASLKSVDIDKTLIEKYRELRRIDRFDQFNDRTSAMYLAVAMAYPGVQVYACGSRVRGCYIDFMAKDYHNIQQARELAGMKNKLTSDYDYWVEPGAVAKIDLPDCCERVRCRVDLKIPIPIYNG